MKKIRKDGRITYEIGPPQVSDDKYPMTTQELSFYERPGAVHGDEWGQFHDGMTHVSIWRRGQIAYMYLYPDGAKDHGLSNKIISLGDIGVRQGGSGE